MVYVVGKAGRQDWQHVYTAVTRGRSRVYVIAEEAHLRSAILRNNVRRKTRLKHFLQSELSAGCASPAEFASPSKGSGDSGQPSPQRPASLRPPAAADLAADLVPSSVPRSQASAAEVETFVSAAGGWGWPPPEAADAGRDPAHARGSKRTCPGTDAESPSKVLMVGALFSCARAFPKCRPPRGAGVCQVLCTARVPHGAGGCRTGVLRPLCNVPSGALLVLAASRQLRMGSPEKLLCPLHLLSASLHPPSPPLSGRSLTVTLTAVEVAGCGLANWRGLS